MTGPAAAPLLLVDAEDALRARSGAVGTLIEQDALSIIEAGDRLRDLAERFDVGRLLPKPNTCDVCGCAPCATPGFCNESRRLDADPRVIAERERALGRLPPNWHVMSFDALAAALNRRDGVAQSTIDAAVHVMRRSGARGLREFLRGRLPEETIEIVAQIRRRRKKQ
jgi:hypothetical protein